MVISDRMLSHARQYLCALVTAIESEICLIAMEQFGVSNEAIKSLAARENSRSYELLETTGVLKKQTLLNSVFVNAQKEELQSRLLQKTSQEDLENTLTQHLDDEDNAIAEAAMALLVAHGRKAASLVSLSDLSAETLHALAWPVVAALEKLANYTGNGLIMAAENMLGLHDESASVESRAGRLALLLSNPNRTFCLQPHPLNDGLHLFLAKLARQSGLSVDQITIFTAEPNMARLVIVMRASELPPEHALSIFATLEASGAILTAASYNEIDIETAKGLMAKWRMNLSYLEAETLFSVNTDGAYLG
ncbi:hypothetical protein [Parasphingorhabdus halotolerans]|uniref:DUF2336 domain-containing protein n=1 Tax=Parasphingorhabdus halotolerans TaxID=2725558 RepID=A0A6H2DIX7_9SPHN|nr:hypothetical protein [Parasphingorhabdus halotolerans]QJB68097.1 hypothetical protein HF685_01225 [Parasphingorhabdus halotolerans]